MAVVVGVTSTFFAALPASAGDLADVVVEVVAERHILPADGWSTVRTYVRNDGAVPAQAVTVTTTLPPELKPSSLESSSEWDCDWNVPVMRCTRIGELAPGQRSMVIRQSVAVEGASPGAVLEPNASATTSTPESSTANNTAKRQIRIVETGVIEGRLWNDLNADGVRQDNEPRADVGLSMWSQDDDDNYGFSNNHTGTYSQTVPAKRFKVDTSLFASSWRFTTPNVGSDATDSDLRLTGENAYNRYGESDVFSVDPAVPSVIDLGVVAAFRPTKISPASATVGSTTTVTLTGEHFYTGMTVQLTRPAAEPISGTIKSVSTDRKTMKVSFPLKRVATGKWTLVVETMSARAELADAFTVKRRRTGGQGS